MKIKLYGYLENEIKSLKDQLCYNRSEQGKVDGYFMNINEERVYCILLYRNV